MEPAILLLSLVPLLSWGIADFFVVFALRRATVFAVFFWGQLANFGLLMVGSVLFAGIPHITLAGIALLMVSGVLGVVSYLLFYRGLQTGVVSVVSPISGIAPVFTVLLALAFLGEHLTGIQGAGIAIAVSGAVLSSLKLGEWKGLGRMSVEKGAYLGFLTALCWGAYYACLDVLVQGMGWLAAFMLVKLVSLAVFFMISPAYPKKDSSLRVARPAIFLVLAIGLLEFLGFASYGAAVTVEQVSLVYPIASAFPIVTVLLAQLFLKERLEWGQYAGVGMAIAGVIIISL